MEKKVLLFSGGFDSLLQEFLIKPDVLLYVDMETSYSKAEVSFLKTLPFRYLNRLIIKYLPLGEYERENKYLPFRNLLLGTIALQYGQHVFFGFNAADDAPDKDDAFLKRTSMLFKHLNKNAICDMGWENKKFSFSAPYKDLTKTEMVSLCLSSGMSPDLIKNIRTCYDSHSSKGCGICRPCINKAIALLNNGIYEESLFDIPITKKILSESLMDTTNSILSGDKLPIRYAEEIKRAIEQL